MTYTCVSTTWKAEEDNLSKAIWDPKKDFHKKQNKIKNNNKTSNNPPKSLYNILKKCGDGLKDIS